MKMTGKATAKMERLQLATQAKALAERKVATGHGVHPAVVSLIDDESWMPGNVSVATLRSAWWTGPLGGTSQQYTPGLRDIVTRQHWLHDRMANYGVPHASLTGGVSCAGVNLPSDDEVGRAVAARWGHMAAHGCDRTKLYAQTSLAGRMYDAVYSADGLMRVVYTVTVCDLADLYHGLHRLGRLVYEPAWTRDYVGLHAALTAHRGWLPTVNGLPQIADPIDKILTVLALFWEWERVFDMLECAGGSKRITETVLAAALKSSTCLTMAAGAADRLSGYLYGTWTHVLSLVDFSATGVGGHAPEMPLLAFGPSGTPTNADPVKGLCTSSAHAMLSRTHAAVPPFAEKTGLKHVAHDYPAHFLNGSTVGEIALAAPKMIYESLPGFCGFEKGSAGISIYSAMGRLGAIVLGNICRESAQALIELGIANAKDGSVSAAVCPADLTYSEDWPLLIDSACELAAKADPNSLQAKLISLASKNGNLGDRLFERSVRDTTVKVRARMAMVESVMPGLQLGFDARFWGTSASTGSSPFAWPISSLTALMPGVASTDPSVIAFCQDVAFELRTGVISPTEDPLLRLVPPLIPCLVVAADGTMTLAGSIGSPVNDNAAASGDGPAEKVRAAAKAGEVPELVGPSPSEIRKRKSRAEGRGQKKRRGR